jgi:type I restriction enzyme R subunit
VISIATVKKLAAYHQYYAVNAAVASTLRAASSVEKNLVRQTPASYGLPGVQNQPPGDRKAGVVWHTQGSGKSLSMVFYTGKIVLALDNPTVLVITDRNDLDDQLFDTFAASKQLLRQEPVQAESREQFKELLKVTSGGVVFSTIQKFQPDQGNVYELLSARSNIVVIADEAHRTQYGFSAKTVDEKNAGGEVVGKRWCTALPNICAMLCPTPPIWALPAPQSKKQTSTLRRCSATMWTSTILLRRWKTARRCEFSTKAVWRKWV